jgi:respiratory burst oxidase
METSRSEDSANSFGVSTASSNRRRAYRTSRAHFYWVTREAGSFEWFKGVMNEVAEMDNKVRFHRSQKCYLSVIHFVLTNS